MNAETVFQSYLPRRKSKFQCQNAYFKVSCYIPHGNCRKNGVCFIKFYTHEGDVLGIRHRLNALPHVLRQSSWPRQLTSMSTFLTDVFVRALDNARENVKFFLYSDSLLVRLLSAAIGLLLSICEAETAIIRHNYTMGAILNVCVSLCARRSQ